VDRKVWRRKEKAA